MTNEEKANELSKKGFKDFNNPYTRVTVNHIKGCCVEIAQWKDEQFYKFLLWLDDHYVIKRFTDGEPMTYAELIDNFKSNSYERNTTKTD